MVCVPRLPKNANVEWHVVIKERKANATLNGKISVTVNVYFQPIEGFSSIWNLKVTLKRSLNQFHAAGHFLYPLKTENKRSMLYFNNLLKT